MGSCNCSLVITLAFNKVHFFQQQESKFLGQLGLSKTKQRTLGKWSKTMREIKVEEVKGEKGTESLSWAGSEGQNLSITSHMK